MSWSEAGGRVRGWLRAGAFVDDDRRISNLVFRSRVVVLALLGLAALVLPEASADRFGLVAWVSLVGVPYAVGAAVYGRRMRRLPTAMVVFESTLPAVVVGLFPDTMWAPMLVVGTANLGLHAVLFPRAVAYTSVALMAVSFGTAGVLVDPPAWTLAVACIVLIGPPAVLGLSTVAYRERSARTRFATLIDGVDAVLVEIDPVSRRFTYISHQVEELLGYPAEDWMASETFWADHVHPDDARRCMRVFREAVGEGRDFDVEFRMIAADGRVLWFHARLNVVLDQQGEAQRLRGVVVDVTERRRAEEALRHQALHDALTGLPNRVLLQDRLRHGVAVAERSDDSLALLLMDLDQFKEINDTLGHDHGDRLLQQIGSRLQRVLRDGDTVARLGGDEFAVIVPGADRVGAEIVADKLEAALEHPFQLEDMTVQARASVGIALYPEQGADAETLVQRADVAMYTAKRNGGGHAVYDPEHDRFSVRRLALIGELRRALVSRELELFYQPKLDLRSDRVVGVEALIRWRHPEHGLMGPDRFITLAEVAGLIQPITMWVLDRALRQVRCWLNAGIDLGVSVNISARDLHSVDLPERFAERLDRWHVAPDRLVVEITEHEIMRDRIQAAETLGRLARMGVRVSIDDFGTGYSSLADLRQLPIDEIKIDRSFVADMATDVNDAVIVRSIVDLGHNLGINVVAEGVENAEIRGWLDELGCDELQGYDICHPLPVSQVEAWLRARQIMVPDVVDLDLDGLSAAL